VAISTAFGTSYLQLFRVWTDEVDEAQASQIRQELGGSGCGTRAA
jgi:hypothetical protein